LIVIAGLGATALRRNEELMVATSEAGDAAGDATALAAARPGNYVTPALIVITIFFMAAKPFATQRPAAGARRPIAPPTTQV
jgi:hypothetical protein